MTGENIVEGFLPTRTDISTSADGTSVALMFRQHDGAAVNVNMSRANFARLSTQMARVIGDPLLAQTEPSNQPSVIASAIQLVSSPDSAAVVLEVFPLEPAAPFRLGIPPELVQMLRSALQVAKIAPP